MTLRQFNTSRQSDSPPTQTPSLLQATESSQAREVQSKTPFFFCDPCSPDRWRTPAVPRSTRLALPSDEGHTKSSSLTLSAGGRGSRDRRFHQPARAG